MRVLQYIIFCYVTVLRAGSYPSEIALFLQEQQMVTDNGNKMT